MAPPPLPEGADEDMIQMFEEVMASLTQKVGCMLHSYFLGGRLIQT
jgi:hypothetical protein